MNPALNRAFRCAALFAAIAQATHAATTITMDGGGTTRLNIDDIGFGSNIPAVPPNANFSTSAGAAGVIGTPTIALTWGGSDTWDQYEDWNGRGNVIQAETYNPTEILTLQFTPSANTAVALNGVDFDLWEGGGAMSITWSVEGSTSGTLNSGIWTRSTDGRDSIALDRIGTIGEVLTFRLSNTDGVGLGSYFAIDNLTFDQVPEPSAALLGALGLGAAAMRRRRSSSRG